MRRSKQRPVRMSGNNVIYITVRARSIRRAQWLFTVHVAYVAVVHLITMLNSCLSACYLRLNGAYSGNLCGVLGL